MALEGGKSPKKGGKSKAGGGKGALSMADVDSMLAGIGDEDEDENMSDIDEDDDDLLGELQVTSSGGRHDAINHMGQVFCAPNNGLPMHFKQDRNCLYTLLFMSVVQ